MAVDDSDDRSCEVGLCRAGSGRGGVSVLPPWEGDGVVREESACDADEAEGGDDEVAEVSDAWNADDERELDHVHEHVE